MRTFLMENRKVTPPGVVVVKTKGYFDDQAGRDFQALVRQEMKKGEKRFLLNLKDTPAINSNGVSLLLETLEDTCYDNHGEIQFCCLSGAIQSVFRMTGIAGTFPIHDTEENALKLFTESAS